MFDFETLFVDLCKVENCSRVDKDTATGLPYDFFEKGHVWEIKTEVTFNNTNIDVRLYLNFPSDFPSDFPKIFINAEDYESIKYVPHIDQDYLICIFDKGRNLVMPKTDLSNFIQFMLSKAKRIISDAGDNNYKNQEFEREFKAYWELTYSTTDKVYSSGLCVVSTEGEIKGIRFSEIFFGYEYFLYNSDEDLKKIESLANSYGIRCEEAGILSIDRKFYGPPYDLSAKKTLDIITEHKADYESFKKLCSKFPFRCIVVAFTNKTGKNDELYGWSYKNFEMLPRKLGGVRNPSSKIEYLKNSTVNVLPIQRISFENIGNDRLQRRTTGYVENQKSVVVTGLGSVGSNLIFWLKNLPINKFHLVDPDSLSIENIKRHLLGFNMIAQKKTIAIETFLRSNYPLLSVAVKSESVKKTVQETPQFINDCDFHIIALGSTQLEEFILSSLENEVLIKPAIILWVEPYLASGQMLFIMPNDATKAKKLIVENYPYAVLSDNQQQRDKTYLIEGSCQTGYFPYSGANLIHFLSAIFPAIRNHVINEERISKVYTWVGDKNLLAAENLQLTLFGSENSSFSLIENSI